MKIKEYLRNLIKAKEENAEAIRAKVKASTDVNEVRALGETLEAVLAELQDAKDQLAAAEADESASADEKGEDTERKMNPLATFTMTRSAAPDADIQRRVAFANYVTRGVQMPAEMRATTNTTNAATAIPENLIDSIIETIDAFGMVIGKVTKTSYKVGQTIPVDSTKPTASWVNEGAGSTAFAKTNLGSIVFGAFKLRCEISMTQEVSVQTLPAFEAMFIRQVGEAMAKAIEGKIVSADDGSDCPTGIFYRANGTDATVEIAKLATGHLDFKALCDAEALLPQQYESNAGWLMSKKTFMSIYSLTDSTGQPIGRVNYGVGGKPERTLLGREVILTGSYIADYSESTATEDKVVAALFDLSDYVLNTSYDMGISRKQDWDTEDERVKAVMSVDGKVINRDSLVKIVKKYN